MYFWGSWSVDLRIISAILGPFRPRAIFPYISYSYKCAASNGKAVLEWEHGYIFRPPVWSEIGNFVGTGVQTYICAWNTVQCKIKPRNVHFSRTNGVMVSQTEYIFQKPGLKKSMENGMFVLKYCRNSENRAALTSTKNSKEYTLPPGHWALKK